MSRRYFIIVTTNMGTVDNMTIKNRVVGLPIIVLECE